MWFHFSQKFIQICSYTLCMLTHLVPVAHKHNVCACASPLSIARLDDAVYLLTIDSQADGSQHFCESATECNSQVPKATVNMQAAICVLVTSSPSTVWMMNSDVLVSWGSEQHQGPTLTLMSKHTEQRDLARSCGGSAHPGATMAWPSQSLLGTKVAIYRRTVQKHKLKKYRIKTICILAASIPSELCFEVTCGCYFAERIVVPMWELAEGTQ